MRLSLSSLLLMTTRAALAAVPRPVSEALAARAVDAQCNIPAEFQIQHFLGRSMDGGATLSSFDFSYIDRTTGIQTQCHWDTFTQPILIPSRGSRFACSNPSVQFIWQDSSRQLTMVEGVCPGPDGKTTSEAAGTAPLTLTCDSARSCSDEIQCKSQVDLVTARIYSVQPKPAFK